MKPGFEREWEKLKFRFLMDNCSNSLGRWIIATGPGFSKQVMTNSCHWQAERQATRVLLASRLYRYDHHGELPQKLEDVVPKYLTGIPIDPYNGMPMLYSAEKQKVWSVGQDLVDDGGSIETKSFMPKDVGISLALYPS